MFDILKGPYFREYYEAGFIETSLSLPSALVDEISGHYRQKPVGYNDFPKFFIPRKNLVLVKDIKDSQQKMADYLNQFYRRAVYSEQVFLERVMRHLLDNGLSRFFKTRYLVAGYDIYLNNDHTNKEASTHFDIPNLHHVYETEDDLSLYIPLVDFNDENGGRLSVLPERKVKAPSNVMLRMIRAHFGSDPRYVDEQGRVVPDRIDQQAQVAFVESPAHEALMVLYRAMTDLVKQHYMEDFRSTIETRGTVMMFSNKNFHEAVPWKNTAVEREAYIIRLFPIYDVGIRMKEALHGMPVNRFLLDLERGEIQRHDAAIDPLSLPDAYRLKLRAA